MTESLGTHFITLFSLPKKIGLTRFVCDVCSFLAPLGLFLALLVRSEISAVILLTTMLS